MDTITVRGAYFEALDTLEAHQRRCDGSADCVGCDRLAQKLNQAYAAFRPTLKTGV